MNDQTKPAPTPKLPPIQSGGKIKAIVPQSIEEAFRMADAIYLSGMYPESYAADVNRKTGKQMGEIDRQATTSRIMVGIQKAMEVGLPPISGLSSIYIVNNRPTIFGDGIPAILYSSGKVTRFKEWHEGEWGTDGYVCKCLIQRNDIEDPIEREFSWADAKKAGLTGKTGPWTTHPKRQLQMRARGFAARDGAADLLNGLGIYEEVIDIPEKKTEIDTSSLDDSPTTGTEQQALPKPDNSNLMPDLQFAEEKEKVPAGNNDIETQIDKVVEDAQNQMLGMINNSTSEKTETVFRDENTVCQTCNGKQVVDYTQENPDTGETEEGIQPCPDCNSHASTTE